MWTEVLAGWVLNLCVIMLFVCVSANWHDLCVAGELGAAEWQTASSIAL